MTSISLDINKTGEQIRKVWNFGCNTCHAALWLRQDLPAQVKEAGSLGFKYVRFHNIFSSVVGIYSENEKGEAVYNFDNFHKIFDLIIQNGLLPFMEIGFCPEAIKSSEKTIMHYKASTSKPLSYKKWTGIIKELLCDAIERYGADCVRQWYFEVWNEPDLIFFDGNMDDYFELYDHTVLAIKSVDPALKVGGPATSKCAWISEFIDHVETGSDISGFKPLPCDFISTHAYPSDLPFFTKAVGKVELQNSSVLTQMYTMVKNKINSSSLKGVPLIMGEWNSSAGPLAFNHDEKNNAAFIVKTMSELKNTIDGSLYWNLSDIFEEFGFQYIPFHGGYGMFNVNGIKKSSYNAFKLLDMINGKEIAAEEKGTKPEGSGMISCFDNESRTLNILMYYYIEPDAKAPKPWNVDISIKSAISSTAAYRSFAVNDNSGSAYEWWKKLGSPDYLTLEAMQYLVDKSKTDDFCKNLFKDKNSDTYIANETMYPGDIKLIQISNI